ncbi:hypothetical protein KCP75_07055 [Salmonella enterica subsp. enterica]|nr:hypothetical protein KCP75_07055 [Salmonella enterica subsp. enterica]
MPAASLNARHVISPQAVQKIVHHRNGIEAPAAPQRLNTAPRSVARIFVLPTSAGLFSGYPDLKLSAKWHESQACFR